MIDDYFGTCPHCGNSNGSINIGREHWFFCKDHKTKWCFGWNVFTVLETEEEQRKIYNELGFGEFEKVTPRPPSEETLAEIGRGTEKQDSPAPASLGCDIPF